MGILNVSNLSLLLLLHLYYGCFSSFGNAIDTMASSASINDPQALTSNNGVFRLGFFSLSNSTDRYVGIWYDDKGTFEESVVWVANRNKPLKDTSGVFMISEDGNLVVSNQQSQILWSSNVRNRAATTTTVNVTAQIFDTGNLVLKNGGTTVWESFQEPSNVFIPMMRISSNVRTGEKVKITSWKTSSDPSDGDFSLGLEPLNIPQQLFIWKNNVTPYYRSGPWNGQTFNGLPNMSSSVVEGPSLVNDNQGTFYYTYALADPSYLTTYYLDPQGYIFPRFWDHENRKWSRRRYQGLPRTECDHYGKCSAFGVCDSHKKSICTCLKGFKPNNIDEWNRGNWTNGCTRKWNTPSPLRCEQAFKYGFAKLERVKAPDFAEWSDHLEDECEKLCLNNCSCIAYTYDAGIGCMSWSKDLIDIQKFSNGGINLYIRLPRSELDKKNMTVVLITITVVIGTTITIAISILFLLMWKKKRDRAKTEKTMYMLEDNRKEIKLDQLPLFKFEELTTATINFKPSNKIGEGGFGPVYRGKLLDAKEIAVK